MGRSMASIENLADGRANEPRGAAIHAHPDEHWPAHGVRSRFSFQAAITRDTHARDRYCVGMRARLLIASLSLACNNPADSGGDATDAAEKGDSSTAEAPTATSESGGSAEGGPTNEATDTGESSTGEVVIDCTSEHIMLKTQADVTAIADCTELSGSLKIAGIVTDISELSGLRHVAGALTIWTESLLTSLHGLEDLETVGQLTFAHETIASLEPLAGLTAVGGLHIYGPAVTSLESLAGLTEITGDVYLGFLGQLDSLEGLHNLESIGGKLTVHHSPKLADVNGLRGLRSVGAELTLEDLSIADVSGLYNLESAGALGFIELPIVDLHGLEALTTVGVPGGEPCPVRLDHLPALTSLAALAIEWHDAHAMTIVGTRVTDLGVLAGTEVLHDLSLSYNVELTDLSGLEQLTTVSQTLRLAGNEGLADLSGLAGLKSVGYMGIAGKQAFTDLSALTGLTSIGSLSVDATPLTDLGLPALQYLGNVGITSNAKLTALSGLSGIPMLNSVMVEDNDALVDLSALADLAEVGNYLFIRDNDALTSVAELSALTSVEHSLVVVNNGQLPQADAVAWASSVTAGQIHKVAGNKGYGPPANPCPWMGDGICDEVTGGLGICADGSDGDCCPEGSACE